MPKVNECQRVPEDVVKEVHKKAGIGEKPEEKPQNRPRNPLKERQTVPEETVQEVLKEVERRKEQRKRGSVEPEPVTEGREPPESHNED